MIDRYDYVEKIIPFVGDDLIKVLVGMRRVGKSTMFLQIIDYLKSSGIDSEHIISLNFEVWEARDLLDPNSLHDYISAKIIDDSKYYLFLDEIQEVDGFERVINSLSVSKNVDIYITGSNSHLLSGELSTFLTGRYVSFEIFPLSFKEIVEANPEADRDRLFTEYINFGGLPSIQRFDAPDQKKLFLSDLFNSILLKDLVKRYNIRDVDLLERLLIYMMENTSGVFSPNSIAKVLKNEKRAFSRETIYTYVKYCQSAFLLYSAPRYDIKGKEHLKTLEKIFINDQGLRSIYFNNSPDIEKILENIIFFHLRRKGYTVSVGTIGDKEVDFVAVKDNQKLYLQVAYLLASQQIIDREFAPLRQITDNFPKLVLSLDKFDFSQDGIVHRKLVEFLLE
ncbi:MAG: ATP-binding protein [Spirochaetales bacterium]|nr:ATP-binding protein [Spirochaetales bacterium]